MPLVAASVVRGLEGSYLSESGERIPDRINLLYSDAPVALSTNFDSLAAYVGELKTRGHGSVVGRSSFD